MTRSPVGGTPDNLDLPLYGAGPVQAVVRFFKRWLKFQGRSSRSEFWWSMLAQFLVNAVMAAAMFSLELALAGGSTTPTPPACATSMRGRERRRRSELKGEAAVRRRGPRLPETERGPRIRADPGPSSARRLEVEALCRLTQRRAASAAPWWWCRAPG